MNGISIHTRDATVCTLPSNDGAIVTMSGTEFVRFSLSRHAHAGTVILGALQKYIRGQRDLWEKADAAAMTADRLRAATDVVAGFTLEEVKQRPGDALELIRLLAESIRSLTESDRMHRETIDRVSTAQREAMHTLGDVLLDLGLVEDPK